LAVRYGYLAPGACPERWGADAVVDSPKQLARLLQAGFP